MDRLDELAVAIIDAGSLAGAARRLRRSAPAVTRALNDLEERLGARLIERTTRRLSPTDAGRELAPRARQLLGDYDSFLGDIAPASVRGLLRVTAPLVFGRRHVTPVVSAFLDAHPEAEIDLALNDRNLDLIANDINIAVRIGRLSDSGLVARRVGAVRRMVVASPDYIARRGAPAAPADLAGHDMILTVGAQTLPEWRFGPDDHGPVVRFMPRLTISDNDAVLLAARAGRGVARALSYQVADDLAAGSLVRLLPSFEPPPLPVQIVAPGKRMAPKARAFLDFAARALSRLSVIREGE